VAIVPSGKETTVALFAVWSWVPALLNWLILVLSFILILLVLIQRGKGGGLAGAFGGVGGSSAFGSRAGDLFTRITISIAAVWIVLTMIQVVAVQSVAREHTGSQVVPLGSAPGEGP
jgi:preprotein translocase subunit SecG